MRFLQAATSSRQSPKSINTNNNNSIPENINTNTDQSNIPQTSNNNQIRERSHSPSLPPIKTRKIEKETKEASMQTENQEEKIISNNDSDKFNIPEIATDPRQECSCAHEIRSAALFWIARSLIHGIESEKIRDKAIIIFSKQEILEAYKAVCRKCKMTINEKKDAEKTTNQLCKEILQIINIPEYDLRSWKFSIPVELEDRLPFHAF